VSAIRKVTTGGFYLSPLLGETLLQHIANGGGRAERKVAGLSDRELQIFQMVGSGMGPAAIARELTLSVKTVEAHKQHVKEKLRLSSGGELNRRARKWVRECGLRGRDSPLDVKAEVVIKAGAT
jgi:DNA-binding NarL/FixJ family response regulator